MERPIIAHTMEETARYAIPALPNVRKSDHAPEEKCGAGFGLELSDL